jgi:hypothetical protein
MQNLSQLVMREAEFPPPDRRDNADSGIVERVAQGIPSDHSGRANDYKTLIIARRLHDRLAGYAESMGLKSSDWIGVKRLRSRLSSHSFLGEISEL